MNKSKHPLKREENLMVFSHEHYHGLVFCSRLKESENTDENTLRRFVKSFWTTYLAGHFENEEKTLLLLLSEKNIREQFLKEHSQIRSLVYTIEEKNSNAFELVLQLGDTLNKHIRFEERVMFLWLEKTITPDKLKAIGLALIDTKISTHLFSPKFWKNEN